MHPPAGRPWVVAHRGASAAFRENTVEAFRAAAAMGADGVELDVRRTADRQAAVHHDAEVPGLGPLISLTAADLRRRAPWIPTLEEALAACRGLWVDVEVKNSPAEPDWDPTDALVAEVVQQLSAGECAGRALVSSFNQTTLARARALAPALPTGWLVARLLPGEDPVRAAGRGRHAMLLPRAALLGADAGAGLIRSAQRAGLLVVAWTVDDGAEVRRLAAAGIDGVITNRPDVALSALGEHRHRDSG